MKERTREESECALRANALVKGGRECQWRPEPP